MTTYTWPPGMAIKPIVQWPGTLRGWRERSRSNFSASWSSTLQLLRRELEFLGGKNLVLQIAMTERDFRIDGYPRATAKAEHPGVILTLDSRHGPLSYPCDAFDDWQDNLRAIALALEALRKVDRYGVTKRGEQYTGFKALPPGGVALPAQMTEGEARQVIGDLSETGIADARSFRLAQRWTHPDQGGNSVDFDKVMRAGRVLGLTA